MYHLSNNNEYLQYLDHITSRVSGIYVFTKQIYYYDTDIISFVLLQNLLLLYGLSRLLYYYNNIYWIPTHFYFHMFVSFVLSSNYII